MGEHKKCMDEGNICMRNDGARDSKEYLKFMEYLQYKDKHVEHDLTEVTLEIIEGKKREIRKILAYCGHYVLNLRREAYGCFELGSLQAGDIRAATKQEMEWVMNL